MLILFLFRFFFLRSIYKLIKMICFIIYFYNDKGEFNKNSHDIIFIINGFMRKCLIRYLFFLSFFKKGGSYQFPYSVLIIALNEHYCTAIFFHVHVLFLHISFQIVLFIVQSSSSPTPRHL